MEKTTSGGNPAPSEAAPESFEKGDWLRAQRRYEPENRVLRGACTLFQRALEEESDRVFLYLLLLLTTVPIVELIILFRIADRFQWGPTIALVLLTGILGAWLARREGLKTLSRIQTDLARGVPPTGAMVDGLLILVAGAVLITPGILTDLLGFALLIPPCRTRIRRRLAEAFKKRVIIHHPTHFDTAPDDFVDVQAASRDADEPDHNRLP